MWQDPIVEEIRKQRFKIEADCGNDFNKIFEKALEVQNKFAKRLVSKPAEKNKTVSEIP